MKRKAGANKVSIKRLRKGEFPVDVWFDSIKGEIVFHKDHDLEIMKKSNLLSLCKFHFTLVEELSRAHA